MTSVELFQQVVRALQAANVDSGKFKVLLDINREDPVHLVSNPWSTCSYARSTKPPMYPNTVAVDFIHNVCKDVINSSAVNKKDTMEMVSIAVACCMARAEAASRKTYLPSHVTEVIPYAILGDERYAEGADGNSEFRSIKKELDSQMDDILETWMLSQSTEPHIYHKGLDIPPTLSLLAHIFISERAYKANIIETFELANDPNTVGASYSSVHHGFRRSIEHLNHLGLIVYRKEMTTENGHILDNFKIQATINGKELYDKMKEVGLKKLLPLHDIEDPDSEQLIVKGITTYGIQDSWIIDEILSDYDATETLYNMYFYPMHHVVEGSRLLQESTFSQHSQREYVNKLLRENWKMYRNPLRMALDNIAFFEEESVPRNATPEFDEAVTKLVREMRSQNFEDTDHHMWTRKIQTNNMLRLKLVSMGLVVKNPMYDSHGTAHPLFSELPPFLLSGLGLVVAHRIMQMFTLENDLSLTSIDVWGLQNANSYHSMRMKDLRGDFVDEQADVDAAELLLSSNDTSEEGEGVVVQKPKINRVSGSKALED